MNSRFVIHRKIAILSFVLKFKKKNGSATCVDNILSGVLYISCTFTSEALHFCKKERKVVAFDFFYCHSRLEIIQYNTFNAHSMGIVFSV